MKKKFLLEVHYSRSLSESCRMRILRFVSKSQRSCFGGFVLSDFLSEPENALNFKFKFLHFWACLLLREHFYMCSFTPHTCICFLLIYSSTSHFPLSLSCILPSLFATMVCASLSLNGKDGLTALIWASNKGHTATVQLLLGAGADKDAENQVREKKKKYTQRHMWLTSLFGEEAPCDLSTKCCS